MLLRYLHYIFFSISCSQLILAFLSPYVLAEPVLQEEPIHVEKIEHFPRKVLELEAKHQSDDFNKKLKNSLAQVERESPTEKINPQPEKEEDKWHLKIQPYATIPITTYGSSTIKGRTVEYHLDLGDVLEILRVTASGRVEAWHNDLGFIIDAYYVSLNGNGIKDSRPPFRTSFESNLTFDQGIYDFALSYHFGAPAMYSLPEKPSEKNFPLFSFEPIAGVRLNTITSTINSTLNFGIIDKTFEKSLTRGRTWFEPMVGAKIALQVSDPVTLWVRGDVSGFGLAGDTDLSWNIIAGADWWVSQSISLQLGYRFYQINYKNGTGNNTFGLENSFNGPYLAATFNF